MNRPLRIECIYERQMITKFCKNNGNATFWSNECHIIYFKLLVGTFNYLLIDDQPYFASTEGFSKDIKERTNVH